MQRLTWIVGVQNSAKRECHIVVFAIRPIDKLFYCALEFFDELLGMQDMLEVLA
jgi:hypothetical protein